MKPVYFGTEQIIEQDRAYKGSLFSEVRDALIRFRIAAQESSMFSAWRRLTPLKAKLGSGQFEFRVQASACSFRRMNVRSKLKLEL